MSSEQTIGMLIEPMLSWATWVGKEDINILFITYAFPAGKLFSTVKGDRLEQVSWKMVKPIVKGLLNTASFSPLCLQRDNGF